DDRRQRRHTDCHAQAENDESREKRDPGAAADRGKREQCKACCGNERTEDQWRPRAIARNQASRPAREKKHEQDHGQTSSASDGRGVSTHLNEIQREQEEENAKRGIKKQRQQVGSSKRV